MNAATWIDRRLADGQAEPARDTGFGHDVREAEARRRQWLVEQDLAVERGGKVRVAANALEQLRRRELLRIADRLSNELGRGYVEASVGDRIEGVVRRPVEMVSGRYAVIERAHDFTLVPWKPTLERQIGKPVSRHRFAKRGSAGRSVVSAEVRRSVDAQRQFSYILCMAGMGTTCMAVT